MSSELTRRKERTEACKRAREFYRIFGVKPPKAYWDAANDAWTKLRAVVDPINHFRRMKRGKDGC